jgi:hypothetical protein
VTANELQILVYILLYVGAFPIAAQFGVSLWLPGQLLYNVGSDDVHTLVSLNFNRL